MLHLVEVIAVLDELTPTSPVTLASVHVTAVLARTANPAADPSPPEAWAGTADTPPSVAKKRRPRTRTLKSVRPTAFIPPSPIGAIPTAGSHATAANPRSTCITKSAKVSTDREWLTRRPFGRPAIALPPPSTPAQLSWRGSLRAENRVDVESRSSVRKATDR